MAKELIVYAVIITYEDYSQDLDDIYPTEESAKRHAQKLIDKGALSDEEIEKMPDNYLPIYAIMAAIYEKHVGWFTSGSVEPKTNRATRRKCNFYKGLL